MKRKEGIFIFCLLSLFLMAEPVYESNDSEFVSSFQEDSYSNTAFHQKPTLVSLKRELKRQKERIDGLTTLVEGLSKTLFEQQQKKSTAVEQDSNRELLTKLAEMIDKINREYVSKEELEQILARLEKENISSNKPADPVKKKRIALEEKSNAALYSEAVRLFGKRRYDDAKKRFLITDKKQYKPAASNYYLGEIAYYTRQYEDAIFYFKKSASLYDKANYIDVLLLHTAVSLEKTGKIEQARVFYRNVIENYGDHKSAKIAKEKLKAL
ncbi:MAG: tetratricopeptide repeat protein [Sulfurimonas sp.]